MAMNTGRKTVAFDPAVAAILGDGDKRDRDRHMNASERKEAKRQAARVRLVLDVPEWLRDAVMDEAEKRSTSASSMAALLLAVGLREVREGHVEVRRKRSDSPRFDWLVDVSEGDACF